MNVLKSKININQSNLAAEVTVLLHMLKRTHFLNMIVIMLECYGFFGTVAVLYLIMYADTLSISTGSTVMITVFLFLRNEYKMPDLLGELGGSSHVSLSAGSNSRRSWILSLQSYLVSVLPPLHFMSNKE